MSEVVALVERLKRVLLSLPELGLRTGWLRDFLANSSDFDRATVLNGLCEDNERAEPQAREAILVVALLLASLGECHLTDQLRAQSEARHLLSLARLVRRAPPPTVHDRPARELPIPDYGTGRELTVGERKSLARSPNRRAFDKLLKDPHPLVIRQLLENPRLTEDDVVRMTARRPARLEVLEAVAQYSRWLARPRRAHGHAVQPRRAACHRHAAARRVQPQRAQRGPASLRVLAHPAHRGLGAARTAPAAARVGSARAYALVRSASRGNFFEMGTAGAKPTPIG